MKKRLVSMMMAAVMAASLTACGGGADTGGTGGSSSETSGAVTDAGGGVLKIGGIGPVTGDAAVYGQAVRNAAELAVKEINEAGGINGMTVEFKFEDDEHDPEKSVNAYNTLKDWDMDMLVGTVTSGPCIAVAAESANDNLFQLTPSGSAVECLVDDNVFRVCFSDPNQGAASAQYIGEHELATSVAVIYDSSDVYSSGIYETFEKESQNQPFDIVATAAFTSDSNTDFTVQLQKAKESGAELIFLPIYYKETSLILTQANSMGYAPMFFGCDGLDGILTVENFNTALAEDVMLLTPFAADAEDELTKKFVANYEAAYETTPNQFAADAYDAIYIIKAAAEAGNVTADMSVSDMSDAMKAAMITISLDGLTGEGMTWTADGEPSKAPKAVKIVDGAYTLME